jgi:UTP--glucose-1-phosphate uridylyltransferase
MQPATRSVPKALLPLVDRPSVQWVVEEGVRAGAVEFVIVVSPGVDDLVYSHFEGMGGLSRIAGLEGIEIHWVVQEQPLGLGHAVLSARDAIGDRPFFCQLGDNIVPPGGDALGDLAVASDGRSVMGVREMTDAELASHGVVTTGEWMGERVVEVLGAVEKPGVEAAPSRLGFVGRYVFSPEVFDVLEAVGPGYGGEMQLTDAIAELGSTGRCLAYVVDHPPLDVGNPTGYLQASTVLGLSHPEIGPGYRAFLEGELEGS